MLASSNIAPESARAHPWIWGRRTLPVWLALLICTWLAVPSAAQAQNLCVGNLVYLDTNSNGVYDFNEGVGGVRVEM